MINMLYFIEVVGLTRLKSAEADTVCTNNIIKRKYSQEDCCVLSEDRSNGLFLLNIYESTNNS